MFMAARIEINHVCPKHLNKLAEFLSPNGRPMKKIENKLIQPAISSLTRSNNLG